jgi:hypothetical protein
MASRPRRVNDEADALAGIRGNRESGSREKGMTPGSNPHRHVGIVAQGTTAGAVSFGGIRGRWVDLSAILLLIVLIIHSLVVLGIGLSQPLFDLYNFRQTQTALTAYWLWKGGPWLAYATPVLGYPWSIPFEFPVYQALVALLRLVGIPIDVGGRLVSFAFYLACLWPLSRLFRALGFGRIAFLTVSILFLASPLYLYWSRTVMIESCALFFGLLWLALLTSSLTDLRPAILLWTAAAGIAAVLTKSTTFPAFLLLGGILVLRQILRNGRPVISLSMLILALAAFAVPLAIGYLWVRYSDAIKAENPFGALLTAPRLAPWYLGTWQERTSSAFWHGVMLNRVLPDIFGYGVAVAVVAASGAFVSNRFVWPALAALAAFLLPFAVLTNLHFIHSYYQYANAIFALAIVGLGIAGLVERGYHRAAAALLIALVALQVAFFWRTYAHFLTTDYTTNERLVISATVRSTTPPDSSLIVIGNDWSALIPYYSERKSLAVPDWAPPALLQRVIDNPQAFLADRPLGGIVYCRDNEPPPRLAPLLAGFLAHRKLLAQAGNCQFLAAQR